MISTFCSLPVLFAVINATARKQNFLLQIYTIEGRKNLPGHETKVHTEVKKTVMDGWIDGWMGVQRPVVAISRSYMI